MAFQGVTTEAPLGARIQDLKTNSDWRAAIWVKDVSNDLLRTAPLPVLGGAASIDALASTIPSDYCTRNWARAGPPSRREFEVGSSKVAQHDLDERQSNLT